MESRAHVIALRCGKRAGLHDPMSHSRVESLGGNPCCERQPHVRRRFRRRAALQLGAGAGVAAAAAPYVAHLDRAGARVVDLSDANRRVPAIPNWPVPPIVTRAQWGANEGLRSSGQSYDTTVSKLIVHHTGTPNTITDYAGLCRSILAYETVGRVHRHRVQLADRSARLDLRRALGAELSAGAVRTPARRRARTCAAGTRCTTTREPSASR